MSSTPSVHLTHPPDSYPIDRGNRLDSIDALRGLAALAVALYHVWGHDGTYPWASIGVVTQSLHPHWLSYLTFPFRWGYLGVSFFLVLSGFCIHLPSARNLAKSGSYQFRGKTFYLRRIWRLYPSYFVAVVATFLLLLGVHWLGSINMRTHNEAPTAWDLVAHLTMLHGYTESTFYSIASVFWSLALEFQLYLAYPIFLLLFRKVGTGRAVLLLTFVSLVWRYIFLTYLGAGLISISQSGPYAAMGSVVARMPEWLIGALLAELYIRRDIYKNLAFVRRPILVVMGVVFFALSIFTTLDARFFVVTDPLFGLSFGAFVAAAVLPHKTTSQREPRGIYKGLISLGVISYSFYLFHLQLSWLLSPVIDRLPGLFLPFFARILWLGVSILVVRVIFVVVEKPFLRAPRSGERFYDLFQKVQALLGIKSEGIVKVPREEYAA